MSLWVSPPPRSPGKRRFLAPCFIALFGIATLGGTCDSSLMVRGRVTTCDDRRPVPDAEVVSYGANHPKKRSEKKTELDGRFSIAVNQPPSEEPTVLEVTAKDFAPVRREVSDIDRHQELCLSRK